MSYRLRQNLALSLLAGPLAFIGFTGSAQALDREFTWQDQTLIIPEACLDEERRLIRITPENTALCDDLTEDSIEAFNTALTDDDPANDPIPGDDDDEPDATGSIKPNSGAGNDGETGLTETPGGTDVDPGNSGDNNNAPADPPGQVQ